MEENQKEKPVWLRSDGKLLEQKFCEVYQQEHGLVSQDGAFYTAEGRIKDERELRESLFDILSPWFERGLPKIITNLVEVLRMKARKPGELNDQINILHVANGSYVISDAFFFPDKYICRSRLPVAYNPQAPKPERWLSFVRDLLEEEDILTLQEFMGYCLIPTNKAQKMLIITGRGGEGKSRIGVVMKALLGSAMSTGSIAKVETNRFARADLEHLLVLVDDDLKMEALAQTHHLKTIISAELPMDLEKKGVQSYQGNLNVRFMGFGNDCLHALYDRSHGFFRRQIILSAKERPADRVDDPYLSEKLKAETEGIFLWCIEGLERLICNDFRFTVSRQARQNLLRSMSDGNNAEEFMRSEGYFRFDPEGNATSKQMYECYCDWCEDNALRSLSPQTFWTFLNQNTARFRIRQSHKVPAGNGKLVRGFHGIRILSRF